MGRGTKLDLSIGAHFDEEWQQVEVSKASKSKELLSPKAHRLVFKKEKRRGKTVTLVGPFSLDKSEAAGFLKSWKRKLGCGGTYKDEWMEFQGDIAAKLRPLLIADHFSLK
ncbi:MAG: translation initiation factor [Campylobacterota bacterium]|nr:translation initiation factor [Campylobacterota bacterium]